MQTFIKLFMLFACFNYQQNGLFCGMLSILFWYMMYFNSVSLLTPSRGTLTNILPLSTRRTWPGVNNNTGKTMLGPLFIDVQV